MTDEIRIKFSAQINRKVEHHSFSLIDKYQRQIGADIVTWEQDAIEDPTGWRHGTPGHKFVAYVQNTRNARSYQAAGREHFFDSIEARDKYILGYLNKAQQRFTKQFANWNGGTK